MNKTNTIIIGAGAAGLYCALRALDLNLSVLIIDKMKNSGMKLCITGAGTCNLTNLNKYEDFMKSIGNKKMERFFRHSFINHDSEATVDKFNKMGIPTLIREQNRVFPVSLNAEDVRSCLVRELRKRGCNILLNSEVKDIIKEGNKIIKVITDSGKYCADTFILASGGVSFPQTGSDGSGYKLAIKAGHTINKPLAGLVGINSDLKHTGALHGVVIPDCSVSYIADNVKSGISARGELLFTHFGISGPSVLKLSRKVREGIRKKNFAVSIDFLPEISGEKFEKQLIEDFKKYGKKQVRTILKKYLINSVADLIYKTTGIQKETLCSQLRAEERKLLVKNIKSMILKCKNFRSIKEAIITMGGIPLNEINPKTLSSKLCDNLFFAGEIIDLDADTGGYNLQIAFSTGYKSAESCKSYIEKSEKL